MFELNLKMHLRKIYLFYRKYRMEEARYRLRLISVTYKNIDEIELYVIVSGIKKQILTYKPEDIILEGCCVQCM